MLLAVLSSLLVGAGPDARPVLASGLGTGPVEGRAAHSASPGPAKAARQSPTSKDGRGDPAFLPEVRAGFEGVAKAGRWLTVRVVAANDGPALDADLVLASRAGGEVTAYRQPVELASRARKLVTFQVPGPSGAGALTLTLTSRATGDLLLTRDVPVRIIGPAEFLVGVLSDDGIVPAGLGAIRRGGNPVAVARLAPADLPTDPLAFDGLDALVVRQASSDRLTPDQRAALRSWIEQGGQLVVAGGPGWRRSIEGLDDLLPVSGLWTRQVKHLRVLARYAGVPPPDGDVLVTLGSPIEGARTLLTQDSIPLIVERWIGLGRVTFVGPDPALEPFRGWPGAESLWQRILVGGRAGLPRLDALNGGSYSSSALPRVLSDLLDLGLPHAAWISIFLLGYVVAVGPGQYLLLRRLDRREWAWLGFPVLALGAAGLLLLGAAWLRGPEVRLAAVAMVRVPDGARDAPVETVLGLVAPTRGSFDLTFGTGAVPRPLADRGASATGPTVTIEPGVAGAPSRLEGLRLEGRVLRSFATRDIRPAPRPIFADLTATNGRLEGMLRNTGSERLEDVIFVAAGEALGLGDLGPGESRSVSLSLPTTRASGAWQNGPPPWSVPGAGAGQRRALINSLFSPSRGGDGETTGGALVLAWTRVPPPRLLLGEAPISGTAHQLVEQALPIDFGASQVTIPPGLLGRTVLDGAVTARGDAMSFGARGPVVFQFDLPPDVALARVDRLSVHLATARWASGNVPAPRVALYRWADRTWVDVPLAGTGVANVGFGASFIDGGVIRARIEPLGTEVQVEQLDLSVDGVRE